MLQLGGDSGYVFGQLPWRLRFLKFRNTFLQLKWLWGFVIKESAIRELLDAPDRATSSWRWRLQSVLQNPYFSRILWFWPTLQNELTWIRGDVGIYRDPSNYRHADLYGQFLCDTVAQFAIGPNSPILDLGCNCGRYLNLLVSKGFNNLYGVDLSRRALELMEEWFPDTQGKVKTTHDFFEHFLPKIPDRHFEIVFTHGGTIESVHPSFNMVKEIARVTKNHAILFIREHGFHLRFWEYEFHRQGFVVTNMVRALEHRDPPKPGVNVSHTTLFVFSRTGVELNYPVAKWATPNW